MNVTGPRGNISIVFFTGSVVVPFTSDTKETSCPVMALIKLDFPALVFPKNPICILSEDGVLFKLIASPHQTRIRYAVAYG